MGSLPPKGSQFQHYTEQKNTDNSRESTRNVRACFLLLKPSIMTYILLSLLAGGCLGTAGAFIFLSMMQKKEKSKILQSAEQEAKEIKSRAETFATSAKKEIEEARNDLRDRKQSIVESENRLTEKESRLDKRFEEIDTKRTELLDKEKALDEKIDTIDKKSRSVESKLQEIAHLSQEEAKNLLLTYTEERYEKDILSLIEKKKKDLKLREADIAREILIKAIQQYSGEVTGETTQTMVQLESDDLK